eukprot:3927961-Prymnesium_polylepis.1
MENVSGMRTLLTKKTSRARSVTGLHRAAASGNARFNRQTDGPDSSVIVHTTVTMVVHGHALVAKRHAAAAPLQTTPRPAQPLRLMRCLPPNNASAWGFIRPRTAISS